MLIFDWRIPKDDPHQNGLYLYIDRGSYTPGGKDSTRTMLFLPDRLVPPNLIGAWNRSRVTVDGDRCVIEVNERVVHTSDKRPGGKEAGKFGLGRDGARADFANICIKELPQK